MDLPGGNLDKQIYLHWTAGRYSYKKNGHHTIVQGDGPYINQLNIDQHRKGHTWKILVIIPSRNNVRNDWVIIVPKSKFSQWQ